LKKIKIDRVDSAFSKLIRTRVDWHCEVCGTYYPEGKRQGLHCSHFHGRAIKSTRFCPVNCTAMCYGCHRKMESQPYQFNQWMIDHIGQREFDRLVERANTLVRFRDKDRQEMLAHFKAELERLQSLRDRGKTGRLEFSAWEMP